MEIFHPILTCAQSAELEAELLGGNAEKSYAAILRAGKGAARQTLAEFSALMGESPKILLLGGSGHNAADGAIAALEICKIFPAAKVAAVFPPDSRLKENTLRALSELRAGVPDLRETAPENAEVLREEFFDLIIDGVLGMSFVPPLRADTAKLISLANSIRARLKISIDVPSGASDNPREGGEIFRADATYSTGICKKLLFEPANREFAGRIRYVDIGFFDCAKTRTKFGNIENLALSPSALSFLNNPRPALSDKRTFGHVFILAGSETYPGAALLAVKSALRAGAGLVSAFVPQTLAAAFAAAEPSAIWMGCPTDEFGAIALEALPQIRARLNSATSFLAGPGLTKSPETRALLSEVLKLAPNVPAVLDADAIVPELLRILSQRNAPAIVTPHEGEFLRIAPDASDESLKRACLEYKCVIALKSPATRICDGVKIARQTRGCPALARGGSGDILSGICASLAGGKHLNLSAFEAAALASQWLGLSAERAAAELGETALATSDIPRFMPAALRGAQTM